MEPRPKFQASLSGYLAWAWERLLSETGEENAAEIARMVFREWLDLRAEKIAKRYGVTPERWKQETHGNLASIRGRTGA